MQCHFACLTGSFWYKIFQAAALTKVESTSGKYTSTLKSKVTWVQERRNNLNSNSQAKSIWNVVTGGREAV